MAASLPARGWASSDESLAGFRDQVSSAQRVVAACASGAVGCTPDAVPPDAKVAAAGGAPAFQADWGWLRDALTEAKKQPAQKRTEAMGAARSRLDEWAGDAAADADARTEAASLQSARATANKVLARDEFRAAEGPSWFDRLVARFEDWLGRVFMGMAGMGARNPWIAPLIEWTFFGLAAVGLALFVRRSLARQSLRIALGEAAAATRHQRDATDWARLAEERAGAEDWREAIHCLYWAAVVLLESRNAWRPNPTRTPREYLRLLRPGTEAQRLLRALTAQFERIWYGHGEVGEAEFRAARASFVALAAADLRRQVPGSAATGAVALGAG